MTSPFDISKYKETVFNIGEADPEDTMELMFFISGVFIILLLSPLLYIVSNTIIASLAGFVFGIFDLILSQYLPKKLNFESEDDESESDRNER